MAQSIGSLVAELSANTASFQKDLGKAATMLNSHAAQMNRTVAGMERTISGVGTAFVAALSVGAVTKFFKAQVDLGDQLSKTSEKLGVSVEKMSAWQYGADLSGVQAGELEASLAKLGKTLNDAVADPSSKAAKAFEGLGVSTKDANGQMRSIESVFEDVAAGLGKVDEADPARLAYEMQLFGKSGYHLAPLLKNLQGLSEEARRTGNIVTTDFAKAAEKFNDDLQRMERASGNFARKLATIVVPVLGELVEKLNVAIGAQAELSLDLLEKDRAKLAREYTQLTTAGLSANSARATYLSKQISEVDEKIIAANRAMLQNRAKAQAGGAAGGGTILKPLGTEFDADTARLKARAEAITAQVSPMDQLAQKLAELEKLRPFMTWEAYSEATAQYWQDADEAAEKANGQMAKQRQMLLASIGDYQTLQDEIQRISDLFTDPATGNIMTQHLKQYYDIIDKVQTDWHNKTKDAGKNLVEDTESTVAQLTAAIKGWGDAFTNQLADMVMAGKLNFKELADSIIRDLLRIAIEKQITSNIISSTGGAGPWLSAIGGLLGFADGGNPPIGRASIVGENGPELIVPRSATTVIPNGAMGGSVFNIDARGADREGLARLEGMIRRLDGSIEHRSVSAWVRDRSRGGVTASFA